MSSLIANLNSTPLWNLILQKQKSLTVEFNPSKLSVIIFFINMVVSTQREGTLYEQAKTFNPRFTDHHCIHAQ